MISRICEEFPGTLPSEALRELDDGDPELVFAVIEMRAYAATKRAIDTAQEEGDVPNSPMVDLVFEFTQEALRARGEKD